MKIGPSFNTVAPQSAQQTEAARQQYQVRVLKKALDSHQDAAEKMLKMLEPKGKVIDIKA